MTKDPVDEILDAIRRLGDGPEPAPDDRLAGFIAEQWAGRGGPVTGTSGSP